MSTQEYIISQIEEKLTSINIFIPINIQKEISEIFNNYDIIQKDYIENSMSTCIKHFISAKTIDGLSQSTLKSYVQRLKLFDNYIKKEPKCITTNDIRRYISHIMQERKLKDTSIANNINILRSFFSWLYIEEIIDKNPMLKIKSPKLDKKHLRTALSLEDIERIREHCESPRDKAIFELFYSSGLRLSELVNIKTNDIDFFERSVSVIGKGNKPRIIFFSVKAKLYIQEYLNKRTGESPALFIALVKPYGKLKTRAVQQIIKHLGEKAGINNVHPHILRHSFATHALNSGLEITTIQELMGHSDVSTTQIYAKISKNIIK